MQNQIGKLLFKKIFAWYLVVAVALTLMQIYNEYQTHKSLLDNSLKSTAKIFSHSLSNSVWNLDEAQISSNTHTLVSLEDVTGVKIIDTSGEILALSGVVDTQETQQKKFLYKKEKVIYQDSLIQHSFDLKNVEFSKNILAKVTLYSSYDLIYTKMKSNVIFIIISAMLKSLALMLLFLYFSNKIITQTLNKLIEAIKEMGQGKKKSSVELSKIVENSEMKILLESFQEMENRIIEEDKVHLREREELYHKAHHDALTSLPNLVLFNDRLEMAIRKAKRNTSKFALLYLDLDEFKKINDTLGHFVGDEVLKSVSNTLLNTIRAQDTVARLGGDEFVILLEEINAKEDAQKIAQKIINSLNTPIRVNTHLLEVRTSIGISLYPQNSKYATELMKQADTAMYNAKNIGRNNYQFYAK